MARLGLLFLLVPLVVADAQIGLPFPRRGKTTTTSKKGDQAAPLSHFEGILRKFDAKEIALDLEDARTMVIPVSDATKYEKAGKPFEPDKMKPGDRVGVDASQGEDGVFRAATVEWVREGTPEEKGKVGAPMTIHPKFSDDAPLPSEKEGPPKMQRRDNEDGPPRMRRQPAGPAAETGPSSEPAKPAKAAEPEPERPLPPPTMVRPPDPEPDADDPGRPRLVRGNARRPARPESSQTAPDTTTVASVAPLPKAEAPETPPAAPAPKPAAARSSDEPAVDEFLDQARESAGNFMETLPNYLVQQMITRYTSAAAGARTSWDARDNITCDLIYQDGREHYQNVKRNGKAARIEETGSWSTGEFATLLADVFDPSTAARFARRGSDTLSGRSAAAYRFVVDQPRSHWTVYAPSQIYRPAYRGTIWIDKETRRVLRLEMEARNMPEGFPFDKVETASDYDFVRIGERTYLVPTHSENLSCEAGTRNCSRNVIDFRNYRKFGAESNIDFETVKPEETTQAPPPAAKSKSSKKK